MRIAALSGALGAEVEGLDLSRPLDPGQVRALYDAWLEHLVLVFRNQSLTPDEQRRFSNYFGDLQDLTRTAPTLRQTTRQDVMYIGNTVIDGIKGDLPNGEMQFHSDGAYFERPTQATVLFAVHVPKSGGDTLFANCYKAFAGLPEATRHRLVGMSARNVYDYGDGGTQRPANPSAVAPSFIHPVVTRHADTGRPVLYVSRLMTSEVIGLPKADSDALLQELFDATERPECIYAHRWWPGDVVVWDNRCTLHARTTFDPAEKRALRRMTTKAGRPEAWVPDEPEGRRLVG